MSEGGEMAGMSDETAIAGDTREGSAAQGAAGSIGNMAPTTGATAAAAGVVAGLTRAAVARITNTTTTRIIEADVMHAITRQRRGAQMSSLRTTSEARARGATEVRHPRRRGHTQHTPAPKEWAVRAGHFWLRHTLLGRTFPRYVRTKEQNNRWVLATS